MVAQSEKIAQSGHTAHYLTLLTRFVSWRIKQKKKSELDIEEKYSDNRIQKHRDRKLIDRQL